MSLYADYILERLGKCCIERDNGFATFVYGKDSLGEYVYIEDIFVKKGERKKGVAADMADEIAKIAMGNMGCEWMYGSVDPVAEGATDSMKVLLAYGMKLSHIHNGLIFFKKKLEV